MRTERILEELGGGDRIAFHNNKHSRVNRNSLTVESFSRPSNEKGHIEMSGTRRNLFDKIVTVSRHTLH